MRETAQDSVHFIIDAHQKKGGAGGLHLKSVFKGDGSHIVWHARGAIMSRHLPACEVTNPKEGSVLSWRDGTQQPPKHLQSDEDGEHFLNFPKIHVNVTEKGNA